MELELREAVSCTVWALGTDIGSSVRTVNTTVPQAIASSLDF